MDLNNNDTKFMIGQHQKKTHILYHLYYKESLSNLDAINHLFNDEATNLSINLNQDIEELKEFSKEIKTKYPKANIITTPNIGKDIGGKLALIDNYLKNKTKSDYLLVLHDKKSPQVMNGKKWGDDLLQITKQENLNKIITLFEQDKNTGIICSKNCISNEYIEKNKEFNTTNSHIIKQYLKQFNININDYSFVAGNIFWIRSSIYQDFFSVNNPLEIRSQLEPGNVLDNAKGTNTHSLERIFSWVSTNKGYIIKGI